jgi:hypothetical protein
VLPDQIHTLDRERLIRTLGPIAANTLDLTLTVLRAIFLRPYVADNRVMNLRKI